MIKYVLIIYISIIILFSLIIIIMYVNDKKRAIDNKPRIKEKNLLFVACFGGALGSFIGRIMAHHKTDKIYFSIIIYLSSILQIACLVLQILVLGEII